ncbi:glycosyltransferase 1 domain-containing protein 1-like [Argonauta hians]
MAGLGQNIMILAKINEICGNLSTATRIKGHLEDAGFCCMLQDVAAVSDIDAVLVQHRVSALLALHAYHAGAILARSQQKLCYAVILGGTDVNECHSDPRKMALMASVLQNSKCIIGFSDQMVNKARALWSHLDPGLLLSIPQAVETHPSEFSLLEYLETHNLVPAGVLAQQLDIFLVVGGIRSVKDPLFLTDIFSEWHRDTRSSLLVIIGPKMEEEYYDKFSHQIKRCEGVVYIAGLPPPDTHASIQQSRVLVNSSLSEGMSTAILEAMQLGTPVIARNIPGNAAIVKDGCTGLLYTTPQEFLEKSRRLLQDGALYEGIVAQARCSIDANHNLQQERSAYTRVVQSLLADTQL